MMLKFGKFSESIYQKTKYFSNHVEEVRFTMVQDCRGVWISLISCYITYIYIYLNEYIKTHGCNIVEVLWRVFVFE